MPVTFNQFNQTTTINPTDRVVGYASPTPGGERSWPAGLFTIPAGIIAPFGGQTPPQGWLPCDGRSTAGFPALAAVVGANVPDLRGYFIRGAGTNSDGSAAGPTGVKQQDAIQSFTLSNAAGGATLKGIFASTTRTPRHPPLDGNRGMTEGADFGDGGTGSIARAYNDYANETRPKNIPLLYIIKT